MAATPGLDPGLDPGDGARREAGGERLEPRPQGDMQTIGDEGDEDVRFDALFNGCSLRTITEHRCKTLINNENY
jgi:hypothetical protein